MRTALKSFFAENARADDWLRAPAPVPSEEPALRRLLFEHLRLDSLAPELTVYRHGRKLHFDLLASGCGSESNAAYLVEWCDDLSPIDLTQLLLRLQALAVFCPEQRGRHIHGIVAGKSIPPAVEAAALHAGLLVAHLGKRSFKLKTPPEGPRDFGASCVPAAALIARLDVDEQAAFWYEPERKGEDMTDQELKKLVADLVRAQAATEKQIAESHKEIEAVNQQLSKQLGELGNKFGSFTEGMAWPSMQKLLLEKFKMDTVGPRVLKRLNGRTLELDVLAYANGEANAAYIVEVKSHLRAEGVQQMLRIMEEFLLFFPEHRGKRIYGILAAVDVPKGVKQQALDAGLYLARIHDESFKLDVPAGFQAKDFGRKASK